MTVEEKIEKSEKEGWILIGELEEGTESSKRSLFPIQDRDEPWFLYVSYKKSSYHYAICRGLLDIHNCDYVVFEKRYSTNTILCWYISMDRSYGRLPNGRSLGRKVTKDDCIRLVGCTEGWICVDEEFRDYKIGIDELERKFRTNKDKEWIAKVLSISNLDEEVKERYKNKGVIV